MVKEMEADGEDWHDALHQPTEHYRRLLLVSVGGPVVAEELTPTEVAMLQLEARFFSPQQLVACYAAFHRAHHTPAGKEGRFAGDLRH